MFKVDLILILAPDWMFQFPKKSLRVFVVSTTSFSISKTLENLLAGKIRCKLLPDRDYRSHINVETTKIFPNLAVRY